MSAQNFLSIKKAVSLASVAGVSALLALPAMAQMESSPANSNSPAQCLPMSGEVAPSDSPAGGATMEQMQASGTQSMDQSNLNMNSPYSGSSQANAGYVGSQSLQANNQSSTSASPDSDRLSYLSDVTTPTRGPSGGYTMERFREINGDQVASADMDTRQSYNSSYQSRYQINSITPSVGPAGGYTANSLNNNDMGMNQSSVDNQYSASDTMRPLPGSMSSDRNRPAGEMTPEVSQSLESQSSTNSIYRVGPSSSSSSSQYNSGSAIGGC